MKSELEGYKGKKILVTGGAGFVGSHVAEKLLGQGALVTVFDNFSRGEESWRNVKEILDKGNLNVVFGDILDFDSIKKEVCDKDFVFHFAALPSHRLALKDPRPYAISDVVGTVNVLEAARLLDKKPKILFASSNKVYGKQTPPFKEDLPLQPEGPYGLAKANAEEWCRLYYDYYQVPVVVVRLHHIVGPRSQPDLALSIFTEQAFNRESHIVHGHKTEEGFVSCSAAFTNVFDAADGMLRAMVYDAEFEVFNIGASIETAVKDLALAVQKCVGVKIPIIEKEMYQHEALHHAADPRKSKRLLKWEALTPLEESVRQYVDWRRKVGTRKSASYKEG